MGTCTLARISCWFCRESDSWLCWACCYCQPILDGVGFALLWWPGMMLNFGEACKLSLSACFRNSMPFWIYYGVLSGGDYCERPAMLGG